MLRKIKYEQSKINDFKSPEILKILVVIQYLTKKPITKILMSIMNVYTGSKTHERPIFRTNQIIYLPASSTNKLPPQHTDISSKSSTASVTMAINSRKEPKHEEKNAPKL